MENKEIVQFYNELNFEEVTNYLREKLEIPELEMTYKLKEQRGRYYIEFYSQDLMEYDNGKCLLLQKKRPMAIRLKEQT